MEEKEEMNIFVMFKKIGKHLLDLVKKLGMCLGFFLRKTYKYKWMFLLFMVVAVSYSLYKTTGERKVYEGNLLLSIHDGSSSLFTDMVSSLDRYVTDDDFTGLASALNIPDSLSKKIRGVDSYYLIDMNKDSIFDMIDFSNKYKASDTANVRLNDGIAISLKMSDVSSFSAMETALVNYFSNNKYLQDLNMSRISNLDEMEKLLKKDLTEIDSLQRLEYFERNFKGVKILKDFNINTDKQMFYFNKVDILRQKKAISNELLSKFDVVSVSTSFQPTAKAVNSKIKTAINYCLVSYILFLIVALFYDYKKPIFEYLNKN
ncbi:MAG TPA: hypothetical protein PKW49_11980 [Paludibacteraceae bacterium]|nr:hypothetical protein [Paludibacteraceae bacterium]HQF51026.1 hypothetical protein [Paludibacteraceae bacterium]HQJ90192.1 hypothetical protein [Paludibacteraceae bacterium]